MLSHLDNKVVMITGASSGIGKASAESFAAAGARLILTARRVEKLQEIAAKLAAEYKAQVLPIELDVQDKQAVQQTIADLDESWRNIDILVNNAGVGVTTELMHEASPDDWDSIIDTNVKGLLYVTRAVLPTMVSRNSGHIINIGSTAGHSYYVRGNVYSASKHAVKALTRSLRLDLMGYMIRVTEIDPGMTKTEFSEKRWDKERAEQFYAGFEPLVADDIADAIIYCATRPERVNVSELMVYSTAEAAPTMVHREDINQ
ncbi:MAG: short-chain dehydrogenase [Legionellales bacterium]|nr:short-chain dehydrogenase [Legionellales bacterium]